VREAEKAFYETFVDLQGDDPAFQVDRIMAYQQLAFVSQELGSRQEALAHCRKALAISSQLLADYPGVPEYQSKLWLSCNNVGEMCRQMGRVEEAEQLLLKAVALGKDMLRDHAGVAAHHVGLGRTQNNLGLLYCETQRPKEAWRTFSAALSLLNEANKIDPTGSDSLSELARTELNFGLLSPNTGTTPRRRSAPLKIASPTAASCCGRTRRTRSDAPTWPASSPTSAAVIGKPASQKRSPCSRRPSSSGLL
jgi:tetratricopeptide (TPR) repeat protein